MIEDYLIVAGRIRQELGELERVVARAERAIEAVVADRKIRIFISIRPH
jgi:hypothetical protein